jgi:hypothetical protein
MGITELKDMIVKLKYYITIERKMVRVVKGFVGNMMGDGPY